MQKIYFLTRCYFFYISLRLCVSASQDGKLIVWDSYTTNKVLKSLVRVLCYIKKAKNHQAYRYLLLQMLQITKSDALTWSCCHVPLNANRFWWMLLRKSVPASGHIVCKKEETYLNDMKHESRTEMVSALIGYKSRHIFNHKLFDFIYCYCDYI